MSKKSVGEKAFSQIKKWLTDDCFENKQFYNECKVVYKCSKALVGILKNTLVEMKEDFQVDENFINTIDEMASIIEGMKKISVFKNANSTKQIESHRITSWKSRLLMEKLAIAKLTNDLVVELLDSPMAESALRLAHLYNEILVLNIYGDFKSINLFRNNCPMLLHPLRKLSMTRILQVLATRRAESCSYQFIFGLLSNYFAIDETVVDELARENFLQDGHEMKQEVEEREDKSGEEREEGEKSNKLLVSQNSMSSNTSVEIYRALTKDLNTRGKESGLSQPLEGLWRKEEKRARVLLTLSSRVAPQLLGANLIIPSRTSGNPRPKSSVRNKLTDYYQEVLWGEVGGYLEHILLWWSQDPLGTFPPPRSQNLRDYILELKTIDFIPVLLVPSVNSLLDAMCCHLTSTSWDQLFRKTLVSGANVKRGVFKGYDIEGSATGQMFAEMLSDLIKLNNSCESLYLNLEELPVVEQIPILHRLDHSVHMARLWMSSRCRNLAAKWDLDEFYCTCHTDITKCLQILNSLELFDHGKIPASTSVQVTVCIKMRAKLVSEILENVEKLKRTANECINVLAKDCRTECLAILHMCFPDRTYWRQNGPLPDCASDYVEKYLDAVLRPVFMATHKMTQEIQQTSSAMVLRILCESWLEYVYLHRIKFSEWGAVQLLTDFGAIPTWLMERVQLPKDLLNLLVNHEVLKRCEGVGRLLLRRRGESIRMTAPPLYKSGGEESSADNMPAEMHVPNQEQWLVTRKLMAIGGYSLLSVSVGFFSELFKTSTGTSSGRCADASAPRQSTLARPWHREIVLEEAFQCLLLVSTLEKKIIVDQS